MLQKYFAAPSKEPNQIFNDLIMSKYNSEKYSLCRMSCFDKHNFNFKVLEDKRDTTMSFIDEVVGKMDSINKATLKYLKWAASSNIQKLTVSPNLCMNERTITEMIKKANIRLKELEVTSYGTFLILFCNEIIRNYRETGGSIKLEEKTEVEDIFELFSEKLKFFDENLAPSNNDVLVEDANKNVNMSLNNIEISNSPFSLLIDEKDYIQKSIIQNQLENIDINEREKNIFLFRKFPGINRYLMPELALKEEYFRKAKKCEIYPFLSVSIPLYEKYEVLKRYEEVFKAQIPEQNFDFFDRKYQELMDINLYCQTINNALLFDPEVLTFYNERDDNFFFSTYYRCPKGRMYRKVWKYRYLSKPDFENWKKINQKASELKQEPSAKEANPQPQPTTITPSQQTSTQPINPKKENAKEETKKETEKKDPKATISDPKNDTKQDLNKAIANDTQKPLQPNVFPPQEAVEIPKKEEKKEDILDPNLVLYEADDANVRELKEKVKYMFPSDGGIMIRKYIKNGIYYSFTNYVKKDNLTFGIREVQDEKIKEFWLRFENEVTMLVNYRGSFNPFEDKYDNKNGSILTLNYKNGLCVQVLPNGEICQKRYNLTDEALSEEELYRVITSKASIIRYLQMNKQYIMYANSNVCIIQNDMAINTNNKGLRVAKKINTGEEYEFEPTQVTIQTDPESNTKTMIREDKVMLIKYPEDANTISTLAIHADETRIYTMQLKAEQKTKYIIEHNSNLNLNRLCLSRDQI
jgi:hypothetical protein